MKFQNLGVRGRRSQVQAHPQRQSEFEANWGYSKTLSQKNLYMLIKISLNFKAIEYSPSMGKVLSCNCRIAKVIILLRISVTTLMTHGAEAGRLLGLRLAWSTYEVPSELAQNRGGVA